MGACFTNGVTVSRAYSDTQEAELVAVFQYETDALDFAKARVDREKDSSADYIISNHYSGKITILRGAKAGSP